MRQFFRSTYVKAAVAFIAAGTILICINNVIKNTSIKNGISTLNQVLMPIYIGVFIAFLLCPIYNKLVKKLYGFFKDQKDNGGFLSKISFGTVSPENLKEDPHKVYRHCLTAAKVIATLACMGIVIGFILLIVLAFIPQAVNSVVELVNTMPEKLETLAKWSAVHLKKYPQISKTLNNIANAGSAEVIKWIQNNLLKGNYKNLAATISSSVIQFVKVFINIFVGILISVYLLNYKERIFAGTRKLIAANCSEKRASSLFEFAQIINETFIGFIVGRILDAIVIGFLTFFCMKLLNMPLALLVSGIVGVTNVIPFFGPFLGAIPSFCLLMLEDPRQALYFLVLILIIQQLDGNLIGPKIVGSVIGLNSFWVLIAVLIGGGLFGFLGMALGVPVFAVIYRYIEKGTSKRLKKRDRSTDSLDYMDFDKYGIKREELYGNNSEGEAESE